jgi:hypothetical protein
MALSLPSYCLLRPFLSVTQKRAYVVSSSKGALSLRVQICQRPTFFITFCPASQGLLFCLTPFFFPYPKGSAPLEGYEVSKKGGLTCLAKQPFSAFPKCCAYFLLSTRNGPPKGFLRTVKGICYSEKISKQVALSAALQPPKGVTPLLLFGEANGAQPKGKGSFGGSKEGTLILLFCERQKGAEQKKNTNFFLRFKR